jgi:hypothetical protein
MNREKSERVVAVTIEQTRGWEEDQASPEVALHYVFFLFS